MDHVVTGAQQGALLNEPVPSFKDPLEGIETMSQLLNKALAADYSILSSAGSHAGEVWPTISKRKTADIAQFGDTVWVQNSNALRPDVVQTFCQDFGACYVFFLSRKRNGKAKGLLLTTRQRSTPARQ
jgi:hypothetical protein